MMRLWADFNDIHHHNRTSTLLEFAPSPGELEAGERVELYDGVEEGEGNRCEATITEIKDGLIYLELDWSTWTTEDDRVAKVVLSLTEGNPLTGTLVGSSFEVTERFRGSRIYLAGTKAQTGKLQPS